MPGSVTSSLGEQKVNPAFFRDFLVEQEGFSKNFVEKVVFPFMEGEGPIQFQIDSRQVVHADVFVALPGVHHDGHAFVDRAFEKGACLAIVQQVRPYAGPCLVVDSPEAFLQRLATAWFAHCRESSIDRPYLYAITGSNGKTTTKEWLAQVLGQLRFGEGVFCNPGNWNTEIGTPLAIVRGLRTGHRAAVLEMGMEKLGDLARLGAWFPPDVVGLLNVGSPHIGFTGSLEKTRQGKAELLRSAGEKKPRVLLWDDPQVRSLDEEIPGGPTYFFGKNIPHELLDRSVWLVSNTLEWEQNQWQSVLDLVAGGESLRFRFSCPLHDGFALDFCAALALAMAGGTHAASFRALDTLSFSLPGDRVQWVDFHANWLVFDHYNASLESFEQVLQLLSRMKASAAIDGFSVVAGSIAETGEKWQEIHRNLGTLLMGSGADACFLFSRDPSILAAEELVEASKVVCDDPGEVARQVARFLQNKEKHALLFKASRSIRMEEVIRDVLAFSD